MEYAGFAHPERTVEALAVAPGSVVADLGAGSGRHALAFARDVGEEGVVYAVDVQADMLRRLDNEARRRGLENIRIIHGNIERLHGAKLRSRTADMAFMSNILFQVEDPLRALGEAHRILKLDGRLVVIDWASPEEHAGPHIGPHKRHIYGRQQALADARASRFEYAGYFDAGAHHFGLVFIPV